jgi:2,4-dienoyl-CoA reductase-like NADH-dependent reductase (Old Yellow Enzyme family)
MSQLLSPFKLGGLTLANRVVMAPLTRGRAGLNRLANDYMREYYELRASAGLIITEAVAVSAQGYGWYAAPGLYTTEQRDAWIPVTKAVHDKGGKIFLQLWHMGRQSHSSFHDGAQIVAPSAIAVPAGATTRDINQQSVSYEVPRALETEEIAGVVQDFAHCAALAKEAGFDGVEVHGANGYLIDTFLQSSTNQRTDRYGGPKENRFNFLKEIVEEVGKVFPYDQIGIRFSPNGAFGGMGSSDNFEAYTYYAQQLNKYGLAYLHIMDGLGFGFHGLDKAVTVLDIKKHFDGAVISNITHTKESAEGIIRSGAADLVAFGRLYLSNPDLVERFQHNWPLNEDAPYQGWYGRTPDAKDSLDGYLSYRPYEPPVDATKSA